jgi:hypothetical protein
LLSGSFRGNGVADSWGDFFCEPLDVIDGFDPVEDLNQTPAKPRPSRVDAQISSIAGASGPLPVRSADRPVARTTSIDAQ